jgi:PucR C-terminal helix-turn-helix domain/GGDEF-like domain
VNRSRGAPAVSLPGIRAELVARLRERFSELNEAIYTRVRALSSEPEEEDADYLSGLRVAVSESIEYALASIEQGEDWSGPIPASAMAQACRAARNGVRLDTMLRRYAAGDRLLGEFIMDEADRFPSHALRSILTSQGPQVDRLMAAVSTEYMQEMERMRRSPTQRLGERVQRLLAGDGPPEVGGLDYELEAWHLGMIATGAGAEESVHGLAKRLSRQALAVSRGDGMVWGWLGGRRPLSVDDVEPLLAAMWPDVSLSVGEPRRGVNGWRLTHREAQAAQEVMLRKPQRLTRGSEVILVAALLRDEVLTKSLLETYISPLGGDGYTGASIRETLRAYFEAGLNAATAAAALGVDRHTVQRRLRKAEAALGRRLDSCHAELEVALRLDQLVDAKPPEFAGKTSEFADN